MATSHLEVACFRSTQRHAKVKTVWPTRSHVKSSGWLFTRQTQSLTKMIKLSKSILRSRTWRSSGAILKTSENKHYLFVQWNKYLLNGPESVHLFCGEQRHEHRLQAVSPFILPHLGPFNTRKPCYLFRCLYIMHRPRHIYLLISQFTYINSW